MYRMWVQLPDFQMGASLDKRFCSSRRRRAGRWVTVCLAILNPRSGPGVHECWNSIKKAGVNSITVLFPYLFIYSWPRIHCTVCIRSLTKSLVTAIKQMQTLPSISSPVGETDNIKQTMSQAFITSVINGRKETVQAILECLGAQHRAGHPGGPGDNALLTRVCYPSLGGIVIS